MERVRQEYQTGLFQVGGWLFLLPCRSSNIYSKFCRKEIEIERKRERKR